MSARMAAASAARAAASSPAARRGVSRASARRTPPAAPPRGVRASASPQPRAAAAWAPQPTLRAAVAAHLSLAFDGRARLALPQGDAPAVDVQPLSHIVWAFLGCFLSMALFGFADTYFFHPRNVPFIMGRCAMSCAPAPREPGAHAPRPRGSFGTISVLYFGAGLKAPVLRLWNIVAGHLIAAALAYAAFALIQPLWLARALALVRVPVPVMNFAGLPARADLRAIRRLPRWR